MNNDNIYNRQAIQPLSPVTLYYDFWDEALADLLDLNMM